MATLVLLRKRYYISFFHKRDCWCNWPERAVGGHVQDKKGWAHFWGLWSLGRGGSGFGQVPPCTACEQTWVLTNWRWLLQIGQEWWCLGIYPKLSINSSKVKMHMDNPGSEWRFWKKILAKSQSKRQRWWIRPGRLGHSTQPEGSTRGAQPIMTPAPCQLNLTPRKWERLG
jgi:hypothetical protein